MAKTLALVILLLTACGLPETGLSPSLVTPGDLPEELHPLPAPMVWRLYPGMPTTTSVLHYEIIRGSNAGDDAGDIVMLWYQTDDDLEVAYRSILTIMSDHGPIEPLPGLGEGGWGATSTVDWAHSEIVFVRCKTLTYFTLAVAPADALAAAERVDKRLDWDCKGKRAPLNDNRRAARGRAVDCLSLHTLSFPLEPALAPLALP